MQFGPFFMWLLKCVDHKNVVVKYWFELFIPAIGVATSGDDVESRDMVCVVTWAL